VHLSPACLRGQQAQNSLNDWQFAYAMHRHLASRSQSHFCAIVTVEGSCKLWVVRVCWKRGKVLGRGRNPVSNRCEHNSRQLPAWFGRFWLGCCVIAYVVSYGLLHFVQICAAGPQICATKRFRPYSLYLYLFLCPFRGKKNIKLF